MLQSCLSCLKKGEKINEALHKRIQTALTEQVELPQSDKIWLSSLSLYLLHPAHLLAGGAAASSF